MKGLGRTTVSRVVALNVQNWLFALALTNFHSIVGSPATAMGYLFQTRCSIQGQRWCWVAFEQSFLLARDMIMMIRR